MTTNAVVLLDTPQYTELAWKHLSDNQTYTLLSDDPTQSIASDFNSYLKCCLMDKVIDAGVFDRLRLPEDTNTQAIYFLPKVHNTPLKVRPIVSCSGSPTSHASGYLNALLQPHAARSDSYVKNSLDVIHRLNDLDLPESSLLASLDIEALYTNITHQMAVTSFSR